MEAELSATRYAEVPVADLAGLNTQLTSCSFAATPDSTRSCNASGPTTRPGEEDLSDLMWLYAMKRGLRPRSLAVR
jgi:hypothetical protein